MNIAFVELHIYMHIYMTRLYIEIEECTPSIKITFVSGKKEYSNGRDECAENVA